MKLLNVKMLMRHDTGLEKSYYKPSEKELLEDYLKVVDLLTINEESRLKRKVETLTIEKSRIESLFRDIKLLKKKNKMK